MYDLNKEVIFEFVLHIVKQLTAYLFPKHALSTHLTTVSHTQTYQSIVASLFVRSTLEMYHRMACLPTLIIHVQCVRVRCVSGDIFAIIP